MGTSNLNDRGAGSGSDPAGKNHVQKGNYKIGQTYDAVVVGYNTQKTKVMIKIGNQTQGLYFNKIPKAKPGKVDQVLKTGDQIRVRYIGLSGPNKEFMDFELAD